jgi:predicted ATPase/DNA-binding CsgD family transcriptional regulator
MDLIGRAQELEDLEHLIVSSRARLVTIVGPPGIGKTSLALAAVQRLRTRFENGAVVVELAPLADASQVMTTIGTSLGIADRGDRPVFEKLTANLAGRGMLIVLDNFEHVLGAAPDLTSLLAASPAVAVLVTSRAPLHVDGERTVVVQPLTPPESSALFVRRAGQVRADFGATAANAHAIASICKQLDGVPLAIELAAARVQVLSAEQVAERLTHSFDLLGSGVRRHPERHQTLRLALDWSVRMLGEADRTLLQRLSVFAGGASIDAIEPVCAVQRLVALRQLANQSLLSLDEGCEPPRVRLLEPVRQHALDRLRETGEEHAVRERHAAFFLQLAESAEPELVRQGQITWLERLEREYANLRLAISWYLERHEAEPALRMASALWKFCEVHGHAGEGESWLRRALALDHSESVWRSKALHGASNLAFVRGDYAWSATADQANIVLRRKLGDTRGVGISLNHLAMVMRSLGETERSLQLAREGLAVFRELDDRLWCANGLTCLGITLLDTGAYVAARDALEEALALFRVLGGERRIAIALGNLADLARAEGDHQRAEVFLRQCLELFDRLEDPWGTSAALQSLAFVACDRGHAERATVLFGAAEAQREEADAVVAPADVPEHERGLATLRLRLGARAFETAVAQGRQMSRSAAVAFASSDPASSAASTLTERERDVAALVASGATNKEIADRLVITRRTADTHVGNILKKLGLGSRAQLAVWWVSQSTYL